MTLGSPHDRHWQLC